MNELNQPNPVDNQNQPVVPSGNIATPQKPIKPTYYDSKNKKVTDFLIGLGGGFAVYSVMGSFAAAFTQFLTSKVIPVLIILAAILYFGSIIFFIVKKRKFISIGIASLALIPVLLFLLLWGACALTSSGGLLIF